MYYGDKRKAKVNLYHALVAKGWTCYGYKADESDSMTDYYSPAHWDGIAEKNGLVLVVDQYSQKPTEAKPVYKTEYTPINSEIYEKIEKVKALAERGATEGEKTAAKKQLEKLNNRLDQEEQKKEASKKLLYTIPAYNPHPTKRTLWHLEKDGVILAKGASLFTLYNLPDWYDLSTLKANTNYHERYRQWDVDYKTGESVKIWTDEKIKEFYTPDEKEEKAIKLLNKIINTVEKHAKEFESVTLGDGTKETEEVGKTRGYKKVVKTRTKKVMQVVEHPEIMDITKATHFMLKSNFNYGCYKGLVYKIEKCTDYVQAFKMNKKLTKILTGHATQSNRFNGTIERMNKWIEKGSIIAVSIEEVEVVEEYDALVKDEPQAPKQRKTERKEIRQATPEAQNVEITFNEEKNGIELRFDGKPSEETRTQLKANGFRWSRPQKMWYAKDTDERRAFVSGLNGGEDLYHAEEQKHDTEPQTNAETQSQSETPQEQPEAVAVEVIHNKKMNGIEITFQGVPNESQREKLKAHRFRYHQSKGIYYAKYNSDLMLFAESFLINSAETVAPSENLKEAG